METMKMFMEALLPYFFEIIIAIISLVVARYVIPCIKNDLVPWLKEKRLYNIVKSFVQAAEKLAESGVIEKCDKKAKVIELLEKNRIVVDDVIEGFIEAAVKELDIITSTIYNEIILDDEFEEGLEEVFEEAEEPEVVIETEDI